MKYYNIPADFRKETIDAYDKLNRQYPDSKVVETYGQITVGTMFESGRYFKSIPSVDLIALKEYIDYSRERNIEFNYTFNSPYMHNMEFSDDGILKIKSFLYELYKSGVRILTIAMPSLIDLVKSVDLGFSIKASTICQITNANKALSYKDKGVDRIVLDESVNRDFKTLKAIRNAFGEKVELIVNSLCHKECIYRMFHYLQTSGTYAKELGEHGQGYFTNRCSLKLFDDITQIMRLCWIRPEDIRYYEQIDIRYYKLQGREYVLFGDPIKTLECYFKEEFDGNLMALLDMFNSKFKFKFEVDNKKLDGFIRPFIEKENFCRHDCDNCKYCVKYAQEAINIKQADKMIMLSKRFDKDIDEYTSYIKSVKINESTTDICDFDFDNI